MDYKIVNVISSFKIESPVDLKKIYAIFSNDSVFDETVFNYGVIVLKNKVPKFSFLIYRTGSVICTGAQSIKIAKEADQIINSKFKNKLKYKSISKPKVNNIVCLFQLNKKLDLLELTKELEGAEYEPEQFPAIVFKPLMKNMHPTALIFSNGKIICNGIKTKNEILDLKKFIQRKFASF